MANTVGAIAVCLALWTPAHAQTLGTITGDVKDASGALPGATVTAQNIATNAVRTQQSNEVVKAELDGFRLAQNRVEPHVEETLRVTLSLEIGGITETTEAPFIRIMLSNHAHFVHVGGHALMQRRTGAQVMAMAGTPKRCRAATTRRRSAPSGGSRCRWRAC